MSNPLAAALWRIYNRPNRPIPFSYGGNLPYDERAFGERMLRYHLSETDNAASRVSAERDRQLNFLFQHLDLTPDSHLFDVTCGPGLYAVELARRGLRVHGVDFAPVAIEHARQLVAQAGVAARCRFDVADVRSMDYASHNFDAAILLYGQLAVMTVDEAQQVLHKIAASLRPGARFCLELLNPQRVDKQDSTWWFTDDGQLWGDTPYLHLGERFWDEAAQISTERYQIVHLESGQLDEIILCDQVYSAEKMLAMLHAAGFTSVTIHPAWDQIGLYDEDEWLVYVAEKAADVP